MLGIILGRPRNLRTRDFHFNFLFYYHRFFKYLFTNIFKSFLPVESAWVRAPISLNLWSNFLLNKCYETIFFKANLKFDGSYRADHLESLWFPIANFHTAAACQPLWYFMTIVNWSDIWQFLQRCSLMMSWWWLIFWLSTSNSHFLLWFLR